LKDKKWVFDPKRNLRRGCRTPWLPDEENLTYLVKGYNPYGEDDDQDTSTNEVIVSVTAPAKRGRAPAKKDTEVANDDIVDDTIVDTAPKRRKTRKKAAVVIDADETEQESYVQSQSEGSKRPAPKNDEFVPNIGNLIDKRIEGMVSMLIDNQKQFFSECQRQMECRFQTHLQNHQKEIEKIKSSIQTNVNTQASNSSKKVSVLQQTNKKDDFKDVNVVTPVGSK